MKDLQGRNNDVSSHATYRVAESVVIRDETKFLNSGWYLVADPSQLKSWHFDADGYRLLEYLLEPRSSDDIMQYRANLSTLSALASPAQMAALMRSLEDIGIIERSISRSSHAASICVSENCTSSRYPPASSPLSITVRLPMETEIFNNLLIQADELGVLGINILGDRSSVGCLVTEKNVLNNIRATFSIRMSPCEVDEQTGKDLAVVTEALGHSPFIILDSLTDIEQIESPALTLNALGIPFCAVHSIRPGDDLACLVELTDSVLSAGASFLLLLMTPESVAHKTTVTAISEKLALLQNLQGVHEPTEVQIRITHLPLPLPFAAPEPTLGQLFSQFLGGCSVGLLSQLPVVGRQKGVGLLSPDQASMSGPQLPPNCCQAGMTHVAINEKGTVYPCEEAFKLSDFEMGNLARSSLSEIWSKERWNFFRGGWDLYELVACHGCNLWLDCASRRCRVNPREFLGTYLGPTPTCVSCADDLGLDALKLSQLEIPLTQRSARFQSQDSRTQT